jgi:hypothetical protein
MSDRTERITILAKQRDAYLMLAEAKNDELELLKPSEVKAEKPSLTEIESLKSETKTSSKGDYQLITKAENSDNSAFDKLQKYISEKGGFVTIHGLKCWLFSNDPENKIGLRKK